MSQTWKRRVRAARDVQAAQSRELLDHARLFLKLDIGYLVAVAAGITALQLGSDELLTAANVFAPFPAAFAALVAMDTYTYARLYADHFKRLGSVLPPFVPEFLFQVILRLQPYLHAIFVAFAVGGVHAYGQGMGGAYEEFRALALVQTQVNLHVGKHGIAPRYLRELQQTETLQRAIKRLGGYEQFRIAPKPDGKYEITYAGRDRKFGTADDDEVTWDVSLQDIADRMRSEPRGSGQSAPLRK